MKIIIFLLLLLQVGAGSAAKIYTGTGEVIIAHISPELARVKAREQALLDILQQVTGIEISSQQLVVNAQMASYHILQTHRARVVNSHCQYQVINPQGHLTQRAQCSGEVQAFGKQAPDIQGALIPMGNKEQCDFSTNDFNQSHNTDLLFKSKQRFCLLLNTQEDVYVGVFGMYQQGDEIKISRVFPDNDQTSLQIKAGTIAQLTPLSSEPLAGQKLAQEALVILASREPLQAHALLNNSAGFSAKQTAESSVNMAQFDQALGKLNLNKINIIVLPYAVAR